MYLLTFRLKVKLIIIFFCENGSYETNSGGGETNFFRKEV